MWTHDLATPQHQQDICYYCGAASAQMVLEGIGAGIVSQDDLYQANHNPPVGGWYTYPPRIGDTINKWAPASFTKHHKYKFFSDATAEEGCARIALSIQAGYPVPTVVNGCAHMVVVRGASAHEEPTPTALFTLYGFFINDPWPPVPSTAADCNFHPGASAPPPHSDTDGCGTGVDAAGDDHGNADEYVAILDWLESAERFSGCDGFGDDPFLTACPVPVELERRPLEPWQLPVWVPPWVQAADLVDIRELEEIVKKGAEEQIGAHELGRLVGSSKVGEATLVQRLDHPDSFYYLVPLLHSGTLAGVARVDALRGALLGLRDSRGGDERPSEQLFAERGKLLERALGGFLPLGEGRGRVRLRVGTHEVHPTMVWKPCHQSRSPYYPFHMLVSGAERVFVSHDGVAHAELRPLGAGG
jgi:hypothetical protein